MKLIYLPDDLVIVQDDPDHPIVATLSMAVLPADVDPHRLGHLLASAPQLLICLRQLIGGEREEWGGYYFSGEEADYINDTVVNLDPRTYPIISNTPAQI